MDNERHALEYPIKLSEAAKRIGLDPKTLKLYHITVGEFDAGKLNVRQVNPPKGHYTVLPSEVERFINRGSDKG